MLLIMVAAAFLLALGLQLRARPALAPAGYYLGADGVICMTAWKVVDRAPAPQRPVRSQPLQAAGPSVGPWGPFVQPRDEERIPAAPQAPKILAAPETPAAQLPAPIRFDAADLAACLREDPVGSADAIIVPADLLAELDLAMPRGWSVPPPAAAEDWREQPFGPDPLSLLRAPAGSLSLH